MADVLTSVPPRGLPMSTDRMRWCLATLGWGQRDLARQAPLDESSARRMARGSKAIPDVLAAWLEDLAEAQLRFNAILYRGPDGWRNNGARN